MHFSSDLHSLSGLSNLSNGAQLADGVLVPRLVLGVAEGTLDLLLSAVDWLEGLGADVEGVELVVVQVVLIFRVFITSLKNTREQINAVYFRRKLFSRKMKYNVILYFSLDKTNLQDFPDLCGDLWLGAQLKQPPGKGASGLEVLELEEEVARRPEGEHLMDGLEVAVGEVSRHLAQTLLLSHGLLRTLLPQQLHRQT